MSIRHRHITIIMITVCGSVNHQYQCANSECIDRGYLCDGIPQCADLSDERDCREYQPS